MDNTQVLLIGIGLVLVGILIELERVVKCLVWIATDLRIRSDWRNRFKLSHYGAQGELKQLKRITEPDGYGGWAIAILSTAGVLIVCGKGVELVLDMLQPYFAAIKTYIVNHVGF
jgi:hypothetical protein